MKTIKLFLAVSVLLSLSTNAQITKGNWMVGGSGSFSSKKYTNNYSNGSSEKNTFRMVEITPSIGYFVIDKFALGLKLGYKGEFYSENTIAIGQNYNTFYVGPFLRYYFLKPEKTVNTFIESGYNIGNRHASSSAFESTDTKTNSLNFICGASLFFNNSVGLELTLKYLMENNKINGNELKTNDLQIGLGFQIYLEKNK